MSPPVSPFLLPMSAVNDWPLFMSVISFSTYFCSPTQNAAPLTTLSVTEPPGSHVASISPCPLPAGRLAAAGPAETRAATTTPAAAIRLLRMMSEPFLGNQEGLQHLTHHDLAHVVKRAPIPPGGTGCDRVWVGSLAWAALRVADLHEDPAIVMAEAG